MTRTIALITLLVAAAAALAAADVTLRSEIRPSEAWQWSHRCSPYDVVNLVFAVRQRNLEAVTARLYQVADPEHVDYSQHMTFEEVGELTRDDEALATVEEWLKPHASVVDRTLNGDFVTAKLVVYEAERMLQNEFHAYKHRDTGKLVFRASSAVLPERVGAAVDYVARLVDFPRERPPAISWVPAALGVTPNGTATPPVLQQVYNMPTDKQTPAGTAAAVSLFEALGQNFEPSDVAKFQSQFGLAANPAQKVIGDNSPLTCVLQPNACAEASLDVQVQSLTNGLPWWYWSIKSTDETPFIDWAMAVANTTNPPLVHSISYGGDEAEEPLALKTRFDAEMQKLGLRGVSVLIASGDDGAPGSGARNDPTKCGYAPSWPATSPHVTAVGATQGLESGKPEVACASDTGGLITSGGGFSNTYPRPSWQDSAVSAFLSQTKAAAGYNATGRAEPDVAFAGHNFEILITGQAGIGSGTSASTPLFASMVALVNNNRIAAGKKPLGFLNPAIYAHASVFNDITSGDNKCAAGPVGHEDCCTEGFEATTGWDPVTGLGSVQFDKFNSVFGAL